MARRPTREQLIARIQELESEIEQVRRSRDEFVRRDARQRAAEEMARLGHWELDLVRGSLVWSDEIYRMFGRTPKEFDATFEAFLRYVHPDDRAFVSEAYSSSVKNHTGYDIVHRLLMEDGAVKYVQERCRTEYADSGEPLRSIGTVQDVTERMRSPNAFCGIIGRDVRMQAIFDTVRELAEFKVSVLLQGESGTGKELVAQAIHSEGARARGPFVPVNCGALPEGLLESELFGHVRGAFTGAIRDKKGRFELAHGGTLFLDEVGELPRPLQVNLLRVLQEGTFERVGGEKTIHVDVRVISATNRDLMAEVQAGNFREDLYYRLKVVPVLMPPLRERTSDIPLLIEHFRELAAKEGHRNEGLAPEALARMLDYGWPGNVRELQSVIYYALIKAHGGPILAHHLPPELQTADSSGPPHPATTGPSPRAGGQKLDIESVRDAIAVCGGNKVKAAQHLGVGRATLYRFLAKNPI
jgi:DNA-binding NtrC family response regulator